MMQSSTSLKKNTCLQAITIQVDAVNDSGAEEGANGRVVVVVAGPKNYQTCQTLISPYFCIATRI